jgi:inner membrane protein
VATILTHPIVAITLGKAFRVGHRAIVAGAVLSVVPDVDVIAFGTPLGDWHWLGHRGFTHSLVFALAAAIAVQALLFRDAPWLSRRWSGHAVFLFVCGASHGLLDAMTDGGAGIMFFWPFSLERYFLPWTPLEVSPIGRAFFSEYGLEVLLTELKWVWLPCALAFGSLAVARRLLHMRAAPGERNANVK